MELIIICTIILFFIALTYKIARKIIGTLLIIFGVIGTLTIFGAPIGVIMIIVGVILIFIGNDSSKVSIQNTNIISNSDNVKRVDCPFCSEAIKPTAKVCPFCRRDIPQNDIKPTS